MAKALPTQAWLWHRRLSHLNFDYINLLSKKDVVIGLPKLKYVKDQRCSSCEVSKAKRSSFKTKAVPNDTEHEFTNPFYTPAQEVAESSSRNIGNSNLHTFNQPQDSEYRWTKDYPLTQVCGDPSKPVQTRRQLATDPEMCMFALTVSTAEQKNIKEAMANFAWIETMQEELYQFDRLQVWEFVNKPFGKNVIKLKWLWKNKKDEDQTVIRNKARLVAKGYLMKLGWKPTGKIFKTVGLRLVPTGKIFDSSTTKVDNEPLNGSNEDITNPYECEQTLNGFKEFKSDKQAMTSDHNSSELGIHDQNNEPSSSKLVLKFVPPADKTATSRQKLELLFHHHITMLRLYGGGGIPFQLKSDSLPHAHAQTTKTYYKHQDSSIKKAQVLKTKTSANSDKQYLPLRYQVYQGRLLASFQGDAKYEHVGQDIRSQEEAAPAGEQPGPPAPKTAKQLTAKRNQERVKSILLLAIPDEYLLKFHNVPDAKSL
ncbi:retrovirus-related pol polyprotein from transposon TNT 1-94 [Tanacetum coccineum]